MKLNSITPAIKSEVSLDALAKKAQVVTDAISEHFSRPSLSPKISAARVNLELNAENMSPNEYLMARNYLADLEMSEMIASEMTFIK